MNPVHSSPAPFFAALGHFHAMSKPPNQMLPLYLHVETCQRSFTQELSNAPPELRDRIDRRVRFLISSSDRKSPSAAVRRSIPAPIAPAVLLFFGEAALWYRGVAAVLPQQI